MLDAVTAASPVHERRRSRPGSLERPINARLYRGTWLLVGLPVLLLMGMAFFTEYWFEQLSIVVVFELLLLSDKKLTYRNESEGHSVDARV